VVTNLREVHVQEDVVVHGQPEQRAHEAELLGAPHVVAVDPQRAGVRGGHEHAVLQRQQLRHEQLEKFLPDAAFIDAFLAGKHHFERLAQVDVGRRHHLLHARGSL